MVARCTRIALTVVLLALWAQAQLAGKLGGQGGAGGTAGFQTVSARLVITTTGLADATANTAYSATLTAANGTSPLTWSILFGSLPAGLTLNSATGAITGTPTTPGISNFTVLVTDSSLPTAKVATQDLSIQVDCPILTINSLSPLPPATANVAYSFQFLSSGGLGAQTWTISSGALPTGLTLATTGALTGTTTSAGAFNFGVTTTDSCPLATQSSTKSFQMNVNNTLMINTAASLPAGTTGVAYNLTFAASGGTPPYTWTLDSGSLPGGLLLNSTGVLSGTPTVAGTFTFIVRVTDSLAVTSTQQFTLVVSCPTLSIITSTLPGGTQGQAYSTTLQKQGGFGAISWTVSAGALPTGLTLNTATGVISGTPTTDGTASFTVMATDSCTTAQVVTQDLTITIVSQLTITTLSPLPTATQGTPYTITLNANGGTTPYQWTVPSMPVPVGAIDVLDYAVMKLPDRKSFHLSGDAVKYFALDAGLVWWIKGASGGPWDGEMYDADHIYQWFTENVFSNFSSYKKYRNPVALWPRYFVAGSDIVTYTPGPNLYDITTNCGVDALAPIDNLGVRGELTGPFTENAGGSIGTVSYLLASKWLKCTANDPLACQNREQYKLALGIGQYWWQSSHLSGGVYVVDQTSLNNNKVAGGSPTPNFACGVPNLPVTGAPPPGVTIAQHPQMNLASDTGVLSGTPSQSGTYSIPVQVEDATGTITQKDLTLAVTCPTLSITSISPLPLATQGQAYSFQFLNAGGVAPITWTNAGGTMPAGLSLSTAGVLSGTPTQTGIFNFTVQAADSCAPTGQRRTLAVQLSVQANAGPLTISTSSPLPGAIEGVVYNAQIAATGGTPPYTWALASGTLPAGLTLSSAGVLSGTPTSAGTSTFTIRVTDTLSVTTTKQFSLTVTCPALSITSTTPLPAGTATQAYSFQFTSTGGFGAKTWAVTSGTLPTGLTLASTGALTGTPTTAGTASITVTVTDSCSPTPQASSRIFSLTINPAPVPLQITTSSTPGGTEGAAYSVQLNATGGTTPYTWSISSGALPSGLTLSAAGLISGTPTTTGTFIFTALVTDAVAATASQQYTITIVCPPLAISTTSPLPQGTQNVAYGSVQFTATGGILPIAWSVTSGTLPTGMGLSATGLLTGTPSNSGTFTFSVAAVDSCNPSHQTRTQSYTLTIIPALTITTTSPLPDATEGTAYSATVSAQGGVPPYTWALSAGSLPAGLSLSTGGVISGTPTTTGVASFTVRVTDSASSTTTKALQITTSCPALTLVSVSPLPSGVQNTSYSFQFQASGGITPYTWSRTAGSFPTGLTLTTGGLLSGTPTGTGTSTATVQVADSCSATPQTQSGSFNLTIDPAPVPLSIVTTSPLPAGTQGVAYSTTMSATGGTAPYFWSITAGALPAGLTLSSGGIISGTPTSTGVFTATIQVTDNVGSHVSSSFQITIACTALSITSPSTLPQGTNGSAYSFQLAASGGVTPYTWSLSAGSLPTGVTVSSSGLVSGTPSVNGTFTPTFQVTDSCFGVQTQTQAATLVIKPAVIPLQIVTTSPLPNGTVNVAYSTTMSASGGTTPYTWAVTAGTLPTGLSLSSAGVISGTPTVAGTQTVTIQVTDNVAATASGSFSITVSAASGADNRYCTPSGTWIGATTDNVATLPSGCNYTPLSATPASGPTKTVCGSGCDFTTVNAALTAASCGWIISIKSTSTGTPSGVQQVYAGYTLPAKSCNASNWIIIRNDQFASLPSEGSRISPAWAGIPSLPGRPAYAQPATAGIYVPKIRCATANCIDRASGANFYRLIGQEVTTASGTTIADVTRTTNTDNIIWDRMIIHGGDSATGQSKANITRGLDWQQSTHQSIIDSYLYDFHTVNPGSNCVFFGGTTSAPEGPFKFVNNYCEAADSFSALGGGGVGSTTKTPANLEIRRNHIYKPLFWKTNDPTYFGTQFTVKNCFDWKNAQQALIEGNICENAWGQQGDQPGPLGEWGAKNQSSFVTGKATSSGNTLTATSGTFPASVTSPNCATPSHCVIKFNGASYKAQTRVDSTHVTVSPTPPTTTTAASFTAYAPGLNPNATVADITIRYNSFRHGSRCLEVFNAGSDGGDVAKFTGRFSIHDNVCDDIDGQKWNLTSGACCAWSIGFDVDNGFPGQSMDKITINHNTVLVRLTSGSVGDGPSFGFAAQRSSTGWIGHLVITNNIGAAGLKRVATGVCTGSNTALANLQCWDKLNGVAQNTFCFDHNALAVSTATSGGTTGTANNPPYPAAGESPGCGFATNGTSLPATYNAIGFTSLNGANGGNYLLLNTSPFKNAGSDGKDLGADINAVNAATAGVQ